MSYVNETQHDRLGDKMRTKKTIEWASSLKIIKQNGKICIVGEGGVGKTSLMNVISCGMTLEEAKEEYTIERTPYIDIDVYTAPNGFKIQIYDLSGQRFEAHPIEVLKNQVLVNLDAMVFMFAINNFNSLINLTPWFNDVINFLNVNNMDIPPFYLIGNKVDLKDIREVPKEMPQKVVQQRPQFKRYIELSAYTGEGVNEFVASLMKDISSKHNG